MVHLKGKMMSKDLLCQGCSLQKAHLKRVHSKLIPEIELNMCQMCLNLKHEPRWLIILAAVQFGMTDEIIKYIRENRYTGSKILAEDIV